MGKDNRQDLQHRGNTGEKRVAYVFALIFVLLATGIVAAATFYQKSYERRYRTEIERQLSLIAELKVSELSAWRRERLADASVLFNNQTFSDLVGRALGPPPDVDARRQLAAWMGKYLAYHQYDRVFLLDARGAVRATVPLTPEPTAYHLAEDAAEALGSGKAVFQDFHRDVPDGPIHLSVLVPIFDRPDSGRPLGVLVLRINPKVYLYPFIQSWPTPSSTAETLLVRREGNDAVFLNELRFEKNAALALRTPLTRKDQPAVMAALGKQGVVEGVDYRGVAVIAALRGVPGSPWFLVARMDTSEVYAPLKERGWLTVVFVGALILAAGLGTGLVWRRQSVRFLKEKAKTAEALRESEERLGRAVRSSPFPVMIHAEDGEVIMINEAWTEITGYSHSDIPTTAAWTERAYGQRRKLVQEDISRLYDLKEKVKEGEYAVTTKSGSQRIWEFMSASLGRLPDGRRMAISMAMDVTDRKRAEEALRVSEEQLKQGARVARLGIFDHDHITDKVQWSDTLRQIAGWGPEAEVGLPEWIKLIHPDDRTRIAEAIRRAHDPAGDGRYSVEHRILRDDGSLRWVNIQSQTFFEGEGSARRAVRTIGATVDVTDRKQAEEALRRSEEKFRAIADYTYDWENWVGPDGRLLWVNSAVERMTGYSPQEVMAMEDFPRPLILEEDWPRVQVSFEESVRGLPTALPLEFRIRRKDGQIVWLSVVAQAIYDDQKQLMGHRSSARDITEQKRTEEALQANEARYRGLVELSPDAIFVNRNNRIELVNQAALELFGATSAEGILGKSPLDLFHPDSHELVRGRIQTVLTGRSVPLIEEKILRPDGSVRIAEVAASPFIDEQGTAIQVFLRDITERKRAEEALGESERLLRESQAVARLGTYVLDIATGIWTSSAILDDILGIDETYGRSVEGWVGLIAPPFQHQMDEYFADEVRGKHTRFDKEYKIVRPKTGEERWVHGMGELEFDEQNRPVKMIGTIQDITGRKRAEEALRESEERFKLVATNTPDHLVVQDRDLRYTMVINPQLGLTEEDMLGKTDYDFLPREDADRLMQVKRHVLATGETVHLEVPVASKKVATGHFEGTYVPKFDEQGHVNGLIGYFRNVTDRKRAEEALRKSEQRLRGMFDNAGVGIVEGDSQDRFIAANDRACEILGYKPHELLGMTVHDLTAPEDRPRSDELNAQLHEGRFARFEADKRYLRADGTPVWVHVTVSAIRDLNGRHTGGIATVEDISDRKEAEETLRHRVEELATLNALSRGVNASLSLEEVTGAAMEGVVNAVRPSLAFLFLREGERLILKELLPPSARQRLAAIPEHRVGECMCGLAVREKKPLYSLDIFHDHRCTWDECKKAGMKSFVSLPLMEGDEVFGVIGLASDTERDFKQQAKFLETLAAQVSSAFVNARLFETAQRELADRKRAEEATRQSEIRYRFLFDNMLNGLAYCRMIFEGDQPKDFVYLAVNAAFPKLTGLKGVEGLKVSEVIPGIAQSDPGLLEIYGRVARTGVPEQFETYLKSLKMWFSISVYSPGKGYFVASFDVITERKEAEEQLRALNATLEQRVAERTALAEHRAAQLRALASRLTQAEQKERRRIATILHEHFQQLLVGAKYRLTILRSPASEQERIENIGEIDQILAQAVEASRSLAIELRPPVLYELGLVPALDWLVQRMDKLHGLQVEMTAEDAAEPASDEVRILLFESASELLFNVVKHAKVQAATLRVSRTAGGQIEITVSDEGVGFDPAALRDPKGSKGMGLFSIRERVELLGGTLRVDSTPGRGTRIVIQMPVATG